jgi:hypothetical protein
MISSMQFGNRHHLWQVISEPDIATEGRVSMQPVWRSTHWEVWYFLFRLLPLRLLHLLIFLPVSSIQWLKIPIPQNIRF